MILKSFKYILLTGLGLLLCSCNTFTSDREYENFMRIEEEKIKNELILLERQKQTNQQEMLSIQKQWEQLKKERQLLSQEKAKIEKEKQKLSQQEKQINNKIEQQKVNVKEQSNLEKIKCPPDRPIEKSGKCYPCDELKELSTTSENCALCPNRKFEKALCVLKECPEGYFPVHSGTCFRCSTDIFDFARDYEISKEVCDRCPEREYKNGRCVLKECPKGSVRRNWLLGPGLDCPSCDALHIIDVTEEECNKCPNRIYKNEKCILKECPKDYSLDKRGVCRSCSTTNAFESTKGSCEICSNRKYKDGLCVEQCSENQFLNSAAECVDCLIKDGVPPMRDECNKCPNRVMQGSLCTLKECPKDFPMRNFLGCEACNFPYFFETSPEECAKCPNREMKGNYCVLK